MQNICFTAYIWVYSHTNLFNDCKEISIRKTLHRQDEEVLKTLYYYFAKYIFKSIEQLFKHKKKRSII